VDLIEAAKHTRHIRAFDKSAVADRLGLQFAKIVRMRPVQKPTFDATPDG
jgi:hypothetical protein